MDKPWAKHFTSFRADGLRAPPGGLLWRQSEELNSLKALLGGLVAKWLCSGQTRSHLAQVKLWQLSEQQLAAEAQGKPPKEEKPSVEEELFEALKAKKQGLPAGSSASGAKKGKGKGKVTGKPAAKAQVKSVAKGKVLKRPSAASSGLPAYCPAAPTCSQLASRKACYVDNHYHKAKKVARDASLCEQDACLYARAARAKACETWDSAH